jgi:hypothetical protein
MRFGIYLFRDVRICVVVYRQITLPRGPFASLHSDGSVFSGASISIAVLVYSLFNADAQCGSRISYRADIPSKAIADRRNVLFMGDVHVMRSDCACPIS